VEGISIPFTRFKGHPSYHLFPILVHPKGKVSPSSLRDKLMDGLRNFKIQTSIHYPPIHLFSLYRKQFGFRKGMLPKTEEVSRREITLPLHPRMDGKDVKWITKKVKEIIKAWN
jgi:dTDP-4-amino-4,6-dideoxygalactose transaminase